MMMNHCDNSDNVIAIATVYNKETTTSGKDPTTTTAIVTPVKPGATSVPSYSGSKRHREEENNDIDISLLSLISTSPVSAVVSSSQIQSKSKSKLPPPPPAAAAAFDNQIMMKKLLGTLSNGDHHEYEYDESLRGEYAKALKQLCDWATTKTTATKTGNGSNNDDDDKNDDDDFLNCFLEYNGPKIMINFLHTIPIMKNLYCTSKAIQVLFKCIVGGYYNSNLNSNSNNKSKSSSAECADDARSHNNSSSSLEDGAVAPAAAKEEEDYSDDGEQEGEEQRRKHKKYKKEKKKKKKIKKKKKKEKRSSSTQRKGTKNNKMKGDGGGDENQNENQKAEKEGEDTILLPKDTRGSGIGGIGGSKEFSLEIIHMILKYDGINILLGIHTLCMDMNLNDINRRQWITTVRYIWALFGCIIYYTTPNIIASMMTSKKNGTGRLMNGVWMAAAKNTTPTNNNKTILELQTIIDSGINTMNKIRNNSILGPMSSNATTGIFVTLRNILLLLVVPPSSPPGNNNDDNKDYNDRMMHIKKDFDGKQIILCCAEVFFTTSSSSDDSSNKLSTKLKNSSTEDDDGDGGDDNIENRNCTTEAKIMTTPTLHCHNKRLVLSALEFFIIACHLGLIPSYDHDHIIQFCIVTLMHFSPAIPSSSPPSNKNKDLTISSNNSSSNTIINNNAIQEKALEMLERSVDVLILEEKQDQEKEEEQKHQRRNSLTCEKVEMILRDKLLSKYSQSHSSELLRKIVGNLSRSHKRQMIDSERIK
jgi:hypothetical protein